MTEDWRSIPSCPNYEANAQGQIRHINSKKIRKPSLNSEGFPMISMRVNGRITTRAVAALVAEAFLTNDFDPRFNSVIHLNNNRNDCTLKNLARRPRSFAIEYHNQFDPHILARFGPENIKYRDLMTDEVIQGIGNVAKKYGLLCRKIYHSAAQKGGEPVWPTGQRFVFDHW